VAKKRKLSTQSHRWHPRVVLSATCPVCELSSPSCCWCCHGWQCTLAVSYSWEDKL